MMAKAFVGLLDWYDHMMPLYETKSILYYDYV